MGKQTATLPDYWPSSGTERAENAAGSVPKEVHKMGDLRVLAVEAARSILQNEHDFPSSQDLQALDAARALLARALEGAGSGQSFAGKETDEAIALATA